MDMDSDTFDSSFDSDEKLHDTFNNDYDPSRDR